jgi:hypothetical protein
MEPNRVSVSHSPEDGKRSSVIFLNNEQSPKVSNFECYTPSLEPLKIDKYKY